MYEMINIREVTEEDLPQLLTIYNEIILNTTAVYDYEPHTLEMRKQWFETKQDCRVSRCLWQKKSGKIFGFSSIGPFRAWAAYKYSVENSVYVAADARGKGIGKLLMPPLIEAAKKLQLHTIIAGIDATNEASIKLHENFGFKEVAHFKEVGWKFEDGWI